MVSGGFRASGGRIVPSGVAGGTEGISSRETGECRARVETLIETLRLVLGRHDDPNATIVELVRRLVEDYDRMEQVVYAHKTVRGR